MKRSWVICWVFIWLGLAGICVAGEEADGGEVLLRAGVTGQGEKVEMAEIAGDMVAGDAANHETARNDPQVRQSESEASAATRMAELMKGPGQGGSDEAAGRLKELAETARQMEREATTAPQRMEAIGIENQSLYLLITRYDQQADVGGWVSAMRAGGRRMKALDSDLSEAAGDFWLMTAELIEINRSELQTRAKVEQMAGVLKDYVAKHPDSTIAMQAAAELLMIQPEHREAGDEASRDNAGHESGHPSTGTLMSRDEEQVHNTAAGTEAATAGQSEAGISQSVNKD